MGLRRVSLVLNVPSVEQPLCQSLVRNLVDQVRFRELCTEELQ